MKNSSLEKRMKLERNRFKISDERLLMGSTRNKFPVTLNDGKTVIYISDESKVEETRKKYELLKNSKYGSYSESYIS